MSSNQGMLGSSQRRATYRTVGAGSKVYKRKMEGFDGGQGRRDITGRRRRPRGGQSGGRASAKTIGRNFDQSVAALKQQGVQKVEDEYIKALQEEIKILEYQLKILKDKEMEQQQAVSQIDKFFSDGVPLNDNILALKTQYQTNKKDGARHMEGLHSQKQMSMRVGQDLVRHIDQIKTSQMDLESLTVERTKAMEDELDRLRRLILNEKFLKIDNDKKFREMQHEFKKVTDENLKMNRDLEKERVLSSHKEDIAQTQRIKLKRDLEDTEGFLKEVQSDLDLLNSEQSLNPTVKKYEQKNLELKGNILKIEKYIGMASQKIREAEMLLDTRANEMELEAEQKRELINKKASILLEIDEANKINELVIAQKVKEKEQQDMRDKNKEVEEVRKQRDLVQDRMMQEEDGIEKIAQDKVTVQQDIIENEQIKDKNERDLQLERIQAHELKIDNEFYAQKEKLLNDKVEPIEQTISNYKATIPTYEQEIQKYQDQIDFFEKQIEFSQQVKALDLNEVQVLNNSNNNVNESVLGFIKKYEELQRRSTLTKGLGKGL